MTHPDNPAGPPVALITGAAARIGAALVRTLHARGYDIVLHFNTSRTQAEALAAELNAARAGSVQLLQADLRDIDQTLALARDALACKGRMEVLINNASAFYPTPLASLREEDWINLMRSNAKAPLFLCRELHPALAASGGSIVNIVDSTAMHGLSEFAPYAMAKAALANMTRSLARELAPAVRVNGIAPGIILWPGHEDAPDEAARAAAIARTALKRMGSVGDISAAALFLIESAGYLSGQIIRVDGGAALAGP